MIDSIVYKVISYKYVEDGEVLWVTCFKPSDEVYNGYHVEECYVSDLSEKEKGMFIDDVVNNLQNLFPSRRFE